MRVGGGRAQTCKGWWESVSSGWEGWQVHQWRGGMGCVRVKRVESMRDVRGGGREDVRGMSGEGEGEEVDRVRGIRLKVGRE